MTDKPGRNDPCWCGSDKKYKHCHWRADQTAQPAKKLAAPPPKPSPLPVLSSTLSFSPPSPPELTPEQIAANELWDRFEAVGLEGKIEIFEQKLDEGTLDEIDAFEIPIGIRDVADPLHNAEFRERFPTWIARIRDEYPEFYAQNWGFYTAMLVEDLIADQRWEALPEVLADTQDYYTGKQIDEFIGIQNALLYHGQIETLLDAMRAAWNTRQHLGAIDSWAIDEFGQTIMLLIFYQYLETAAEPHAADPVLWEQLEVYAEPNRDWFESAIQHMTAPAPSAWRPEDFGPAVDAEQWRKNLSGLFLEFMIEQHREADIPLSRSNMMREALAELLHHQLVTSRPKASPLIPEQSTLDRGLGERMNFLSPKSYLVAAVLELLPAYLHFITRLGLIHPVHMDRALTSLRGVWGSGVKALQNYGIDAHCLHAVEAAWVDSTVDDLRDDPALAESRAQPTSKFSPAQPAKVWQTLTFKVSYRPKPSVWFTVEMRGDQTLEDLHQVILDAADFDDDHLHAFYLSGRAFDQTTEYSPSQDAQHSSDIALNQLPLRMKQRFLYVFDFGDQHEFNVQLIATSDRSPQGSHPKIIKQHGKMPSQYEYL